MIINGKALLQRAPIKGMLPTKVHACGVSHGLGEAGYDIRLKQNIQFCHYYGAPNVVVSDGGKTVSVTGGRFTLASAIEEFDMPPDLVGVVHDKSSWARKGLSVFNTVIEPGWKGFLTLELVYHGQTSLIIPAGAGIAQVLFHKLAEMQVYTGRYQNQEDQPTPAKPAL